MEPLELAVAKALLANTKNWWGDFETRLAKIENGEFGTDLSNGGGNDVPLMVIEDEWEGNGNITRTFVNQCMGVWIRNRGTSSLTISIGNVNVNVDAGETFKNVFKPFTALSITTTSEYKVIISSPYNTTVTPSQPSGDTTPPVVTISPVGGTYTTAQIISLSSEAGATIYYTLDGSTPTASSTVFNGIFTLNSSATIKYFAKDSAGNSSTVQTATYTINLAVPDTTPPTVAILPAAGTYTSGQNVTLSADEASTIYYTLDGSTPTTSSTVYSSAISISATTTLRYFAKDVAGNQSNPQSAVYTINLPVDTTPPTVNATPGAGTFTSTQSVTLSSEAGAVIYYTIDGTTPTPSSTVYSSPISINATTTLKYFGKDTAGNSSVVQTAVYTINLADTTAPNNVTNATYTNLSTTSVTLNWTASTSPDVASYDIYNGASFVANTVNTSYTVTGLTASTFYTFYIKAKDTSSNVASGSSISFTTTTAVSDTTPPTVSTSLATGTYTGTQTVTLTGSDNSGGAVTIYYTLDGSTPTTSSAVYSSPISIATTTTLTFIGKDTAGNISTPVSATYTISSGPTNISMTTWVGGLQ